MATRGLHILILASALVVALNGFELRKMRPKGLPTPEDCLNPPMKRLGHECCTPPKEKIWGDLKESLSTCMKKTKLDPTQGAEIMRQESGEGETVPPGGVEMATSTEGTSDSASSPGTETSTTTEGFAHRHRGPQTRKPHHFHRFKNDSCFMECVFEDQGFLVNKKLSKDALLTRLGTTLKTNEPWNAAAVAALETCFSGLQVAPSRSCQSGSEEIFRCVFKQLFFNCPNWVQNDYCTSVKEFYQKCPDGPPPETPDAHTTMAPQDMESPGATEASA